VGLLQPSTLYSQLVCSSLSSAAPAARSLVPRRSSKLQPCRAQSMASSFLLSACSLVLPRRALNRVPASPPSRLPVSMARASSGSAARSSHGARPCPSLVVSVFPSLCWWLASHLSSRGSPSSAAYFPCHGSVLLELSARLARIEPRLLSRLACSPVRALFSHRASPACREVLVHKLSVRSVARQTDCVSCVAHLRSSSTCRSLCVRQYRRFPCPVLTRLSPRQRVPSARLALILIASSILPVIVVRRCVAGAALYTSLSCVVVVPRVSKKSQESGEDEVNSAIFPKRSTNCLDRKIATDLADSCQLLKR
jgi:hypothetical protein